MPPPNRPQEPIQDDVDLYSEPTALVSHCAFFDPDLDGIIWPIDTYNGFRQLGFSIFLSGYGTFMIHLALSWGVGVTHMGGLLPDPLGRLDVRKMHKGIHGSDTNAYTKKGELNHQQFDELFETYTAYPHDSMSFWEMRAMMKGQNDALDPLGSLNAAHEWLSTYALLWPKDGRMKKEEIYGCYTGDIFYKLASARAGREVRQGHRPHGMGQEGLKPPVTGLASACPFSAALVKQKQGHVEDGKESGMEKNQNGYHEQSVGEEEKMVEKILPAGEA